MADNNPTPWPPAPHIGNSQPVKPPANKIAGWISLGMASLGALLFVASFITLAKFGGMLDISGPIGIGVVWWGGALVLGIMGRRSLPGKIGLGISLAIIVGETAMFLWMVAQPSAAPVSAPTAPSPP